MYITNVGVYSKVASSVTAAEITPINPDIPSQTHSITITCTIHPESIADMCEVMAVPDSGDTITGMYVRIYVIYIDNVCYVGTYVCTV